MSYVFRYIFSTKRIRFEGYNCPPKAGPSVDPFKTVIISPFETHCPLCDDKPRLSLPIIICSNARLFWVDGMVLVRTYSRTCTSCNVVFSYKECSEGIYNHDDRILLNRFCHSVFSTNQIILGLLELTLYLLHINMLWLTYWIKFISFVFWCEGKIPKFTWT